jgi:hypothetical protein
MPAKGEDVVETLSSSAVDPALRERVHPRGSNGCTVFDLGPTLETLEQVAAVLPPRP